MGKTARGAEKSAQKAKWKRINTARDFKESHTVGTVFKASDRSYIVTADGSWRRK